MIGDSFSKKNQVTLFSGDCLELLRQIPDESAQLVVTSPPYNIGKEYEKRQKLEKYFEFQEAVIGECHRILKPSGSICWQVGNYVDNGSIVPLDILLYPIFDGLGMKMRNRMVWHFGHGLHASKRFSGRYETIIWFTKGDDYFFNLDPIRVPQKYPGKKAFKGPNKGKLSGNPLGKNPSDVWEIPNVKSNHVEKTDHPCQFPVSLIERLVLSMTRKDDLVVDPFLGVGTTCVAALKNGRRSAGADVEEKYIKIAEKRIKSALAGSLKTRPLDTPVYDPDKSKKILELNTHYSNLGLFQEA
ncbi:MAG: site-specific DNA-methyltransferase [Patescibacteria group bacterium]